jgi:hypothetical protein
VSETRQPYLRIVCGDPTAEEVAALVAVLTARARAAASLPPPTRRPAWSDPSRRLRRPLAHHPGAWRTSALPGL